ncbi:MAG: glucose/arabinose dehydrogenase, partial [Gammaproteobacteria bacterium]
DDKVINEERLLNNKYGRIREVVEGPDGYLYLLTDDTKGKILKLSPL